MRIIIVWLLALMSAMGMLAENRALLVGVGRYPAVTGWREIHGDADVDLLHQALKRNGFNDVVPLKNARATKSEIVKALKALASRCRRGDKVYFHFSGHGQHVTDLNGDEGAKGFDESIVPYDACKTTTTRIKGRFYNGENHLIDDEINPLFAKIKNKIGKKGELFIAIDACYSEDMERAPVADEADISPTRGAEKVLNVRKTSTLSAIPRPGNFSPGARMYVVSACRSDERNFEYRAANGKVYGALTYFIYSLMNITMDFNTWSNMIVAKSPSLPEIFHPDQHPQKRVYK